MYLTYVEQHFEGLGQKAALDQSAHVDYLAQLIDGESCRRADRSTERRIAQARLPVLKTLEQFDWSWAASINQMQIRHLFRLAFLEEKGTSSSSAAFAWARATSPPRWRIPPACKVIRRCLPPPSASSIAWRRRRRPVASSVKCTST
jgi:hypothetical protein